MTPEQQVRNLLAAMGGTVEEVMTTLAEYGIDNRPSPGYMGYMSRCVTCPIAQYLSLRLRVSVEVTRSYVGLRNLGGLVATPRLISWVVVKLDEELDESVVKGMVE